MTPKTRNWIIALAAINAVLVLVIIVQLFVAAANRTVEVIEDRMTESASQQATEDDDLAGQGEATVPEDEPSQGAEPELAPPPAGALALETFTLPSKNIVCTLANESVTCSIANATFTPPAGETCEFRGQLVQMTPGQVAMPCPGQAAAAAGDGTTVLEYGQSATFGPWACSSSERGIDCFSLADGTGFTLARAAFTSYGPGRLI